MRAADGRYEDGLAGVLLGEEFSPQTGNGILYVEDFDTPADRAATAAPEAPPLPLFTAAEIDAARDAGRREGHEEALRDALLTQAQLQAAATQSVADALASARSAQERVAAAQADEAARTALALLAAALPRSMQDHAGIELRAVIEALLPGLRAEPELRVRAHPSQADMVRTLFASRLAASQTVVVSADDALAPADIAIAWAEGDAVRDSAALYAAIRAALAPLNLPVFEELVSGHRN